MNDLTYDPVLDSQTLPKWRLASPLKPPEPGRALVLVLDSGDALTVRSGEEIPSARFGAYQSVFTVDLTEHRLVLDVEPLLSRDPTFSFRGRVDLVCRVADPAEVVRRGIHDMSGALYGHLRRMLREVSRNYDIAEFHEAESALNSTLRAFPGDSAIRLRNIHLELMVDEDEIAASGREYRDVVRETRLDRMRRERHLDLLREEGEAGLVAEVMEREGPRAALAWVEKRKAEERNARLAAAELVLKRGDGDREPFEQAELERTVLEDLVGDGGGLFGEGSRSGRLKGSLTSARGADSPRAEESSRVADRPALRGEVVSPRPGGEGARAHRGERRGGVAAARGSAPSAASAPPDDEPLPSRGTVRVPGDRSGGRLAPRGERAGGDAEGAAPDAVPEDERDSAVTDGPVVRRESRVRGTAKRPQRDDARETRP
ncbi:hypothetical protein [Streptomyces sp. NPDC002104]